MQGFFQPCYITKSSLYVLLLHRIWLYMQPHTWVEPQVLNLKSTVFGGFLEGILKLNLTKPSKMIIKNNLRYYSHLFSQHCFNDKKKQSTSRKKTKNVPLRLELMPFERPIVVWCSNHWATKATEVNGPNSTI